MKWLRNLLLQNLVIKITSLFLAVLTWSYITTQLYHESYAREKETPSIMRVSGEQQLVKTLPIYVNIDGSPANGYRIELDRIAITPSSSMVAGPSQMIKDLSFITTEPVNIDGRNNTVRVNIRLSPIAHCRIGYEGLVHVTVPITRLRRK